MAGMGPPPKDPRLRQRRNKPPTTTATLRVAGQNGRTALEKPDLSIRGEDEAPWHADTLKFWDEVWASPMAAEFIAADVPGLQLLAQLVDRFNYGDFALAAEIRLQRQCFGLTPLDRRRLQWQIETTEAAMRRRPTATPVQAAGTAVRDPRRTLRAVK